MTNQNFGRPSVVSRWQDPANIVLAIWLFISPWVLQFGSQASTVQPVSGSAAVAAVSYAAWDAWVLSVIVFLVSLSAMGRWARGQEWINMILGAWIFAAPWALGFAWGPYPAAEWDHWIVGALIFLVSASALSMQSTIPPRRREATQGESWQHEPQRH